MPNIRDLGISSIPATVRPMMASDGEEETPYNQTTSPPLCGCDPTSQPGCQPTNQPGCQPTSQPGCQPTSQPGCQPTSQPGCQPTSEPGDDNPTCDPTSKPGCNPTYQTRGQSDGASSAIPSEAIAQLKQQLKQHISAEIRN